MKSVLLWFGLLGWFPAGITVSVFGLVFFGLGTSVQFFRCSFKWSGSMNNKPKAPNGSGIVMAIIVGYGLPAIVGVIWWIAT